MNESNKKIEALKSLLWLTPTIHRNLLSKLKKSFKNINKTQFMILINLTDFGEMSMGTMADRINTSSSQLTGLIGELEEMGLVERYTPTSCRRVVNVRITEDGRKCVNSNKQELLMAMLPTFDLLTDEQVDELKRCSERICEILDNLNASKSI